MVFGKNVVLEAIERSAIAIVMSEFEGNEFDFSTMEFKEN